jgi:SPP1 gp7 family putative phage head morphogenesis protein
MNNQCTCGYSHNHPGLNLNSAKLKASLHTYATLRDTTHTTTLRAMFVRDLTKRFRELRGVIRRAIVNEDCFGIKKEDNYGLIFQQSQMSTPGAEAFKFKRSGEKVQAFMEWLNEQVDAGILETTVRPTLGRGVEQAWTNIYIQKSYESGVLQAQAQAKKVGYDIPETGMELDMLGPSAVFKDTLHVDRVGLLYTRTYNDLKGITNAMDLQVSRVLAQGMADGKNPNELAKLLTKTISGPMGDLGITDTLGRFIPAERRARMLARTEIIRAHASATLQEYSRLGVEGIWLNVEILPAGDACPECAEKAGKAYTLAEAEGIIPVHPSCKCSWLPVLEKKGR